MVTTISALKVGCGKFFHGKNMISLLPKEILRLGGKALIVGGPGSIDRVMPLISKDLETEGIEFTVYKHTDQCTTAWAHKYAEIAIEKGYSVLVAIGGGKCMDEVKCASIFSDLPVITVPTSVATCAATSMVAIMYDEIGRRAPAFKLKKEVDVCIADEDFIAFAPRRMLAAGILDSIAKYPESIHQKPSTNYQDCALNEYIQIINSKAIYDFLTSEGRDLYANVGQAKRFKDVILTNLLHTSIVSGFADGSGQLAIAHGTYDFMRNFFTKECADKLHGEIVAVGVIIQMVFNQAPEKDLQKIIDLMTAFEMPLTMSDLGFTATQENIDLFMRELIHAASIKTDTEKEALEKGIRRAL